MAPKTGHCQPECGTRERSQEAPTQGAAGLRKKGDTREEKRGESGGPQSANCVRGARASGAGGDGGSWVARLEVQAPPLTLRPRREKQGAPLSCRRLPRRPTVFPTGYSPPDCPASPWCRTEPTNAEGEEARKRPKRARRRSFCRLSTLPRERRLAALAAAHGHSATYRCGGEAGVCDHPRFPGFSRRIPAQDRRVLLFSYSGLTKATHTRSALDCFTLFHF